MENNQLTKSYLEYKPAVPLWCILINFAHIFGLYFLWSYMEDIIDDLPEMLVYAWDASGQFALAWHASQYLDNMVYAAIMVLGIAIILIIFLRFIPLYFKCTHEVKNVMYKGLYGLLTLLPLIFSGLICYMFFVAIACKKYNMLFVCGLAVIFIALLIIGLVRIFKYYNHHKIKAV